MGCPLPSLSCRPLWVWNNLLKDTFQSISPIKIPELFGHGFLPSASSDASDCRRRIHETIRGKKKRSLHLFFSRTTSPNSFSFFAIMMIPNVRHLIVVSLLFSTSALRKKKKRKDLFSQRWKDEVRPGILQRARCVMCCLKRMHTDHFKDIWRPNGRWRCVAMAATCCTVLRSSSEATAAWKII